MFRHIRTKLIATFAVPLAILVAVAGVEAVSSIDQIQAVNQQTALAKASVGPGGVVHALQVEREYAVLDIMAAGVNLPGPLVGVSPAKAGLDQTPAQIESATDTALTSFRQTVLASGNQAEEDYNGALVTLGSLPAARTDWSAAAGGQAMPDYAGVATKTYDAYTSIIDGLIGDTAQVPLQISDPTLRTGVETLYTSLVKTEAQYQVVQDLMVASWTSAKAEKGAIDQVYQDWGADQSLGQRLAALATGPYVQAVNTLNSGPVDATLASSIKLLHSEGVPQLQMLLGSFSQPTKAASGNTDIALAESQIAAVVNARAASLHDAALEKAIALVAVGLLGTLLGLSLAIAVSRSISRPLVDLARQAERLATEALPSTVQAILEPGTGGEAAELPRFEVQSHDEVGEMARAFDALNQTAIELATGQAALRRSLSDAFINLGRRNQNLVTRQLEYISEIEIKEGDPEALEELFRLDHLATRMRRNAESLLILAGSGPARQWSAAVPAMDVARAASAEVEDYKRLRLHHFDQGMVTGAVTTDLVHIMAELTENALSFSPPGSPVDIYGRFLDGGYVIVIVDAGIGMSAEDLEVANRRLGGEGSEHDVPGRYLGHFVAGRLARRHGIEISLQASHTGGLVARVKIPAELLEGPVPDLSAVAEVRPSAPSQYPSVPTQYAAPAEAGVAEPFGGEAFAAPYEAQTYEGQTYEAQAYDAQPYQAQTYDAQPYDAQPYDAQPYDAQPYDAQPYDAQAAGAMPEAPFYDPSDLLAAAAESFARSQAAPAPPDEAPAADQTLLGLPQAATADHSGELPAWAGAAAGAPGDEDATAWGAEQDRPWDDSPHMEPATAVGRPPWLPPPPVAEPEDVSPGHASPPVYSAPAAAPPVHTAAPAPPVVAPPAVTAPAVATPDLGARATLVTGAGLTAPAVPAGPVEPAVQPAALPVPPAHAAPATPSPASSWDPVARSDHSPAAPLAAPAVPPVRPAPPSSLSDSASHLRAPTPQAPSAPQAHQPPAGPPPQQPAVGPAAQARSTADGLRKLTKRVPGASLPQEDDSLRRATPTTTGPNRMALTGALSQYLSATNEGRTEKEHNGR